MLTEFAVRFCFTQVKHLEWQEKDLQAAVGNKLNTFGTSAALLLESINDNSRRFNRKPVGPLGHLMSLADNRYATCQGTLDLATMCFHCHLACDA